MTDQIENTSSFMKEGYTTVKVPNVSGNALNVVKQVKGDFATNGTQPSFALELDISTIEHVKLNENQYKV
jgi:hypothetical protein